MFIIAKRNYLVRRADGSFYRIEKDYIRQMMRRQSRQQNMTSVLTLRNLRRRKRLRSL